MQISNFLKKYQVLGQDKKNILLSAGYTQERQSCKQRGTTQIFMLFFSCKKFLSVACNSDAKILAAIQTVETTVVRIPEDIEAGMFLMFSVGWTWQGFFRDLDSCWFEKRVITIK